MLKKIISFCILSINLMLFSSCDFTNTISRDEFLKAIEGISMAFETNRNYPLRYEEDNVIYNIHMHFDDEYIYVPFIEEIYFYNINTNYLYILEK